jgi:hypothetical protein
MEFPNAKNKLYYWYANISVEKTGPENNHKVIVVINLVWSK